MVKMYIGKKSVENLTASKKEISIWTAAVQPISEIQSRPRQFGLFS
jgi:hypothetical protein